MTVSRTMYRAPAHAFAPTRADHLRALARAVERLGSGWRHDPEQVLDAKISMAAELRSLARELDTTGGTP